MIVRMVAKPQAALREVTNLKPDPQEVIEHGIMPHHQIKSDKYNVHAYMWNPCHKYISLHACLLKIYVRCISR